MGMLVDRGLCSYDDKISKYWPGYAKNGKDETTIAMMLEHKVLKFVLCISNYC